ncbi:peptide deformylase [Parvularcula sp. ZS-1/3]|uniref:Peptide deformylase n=1 Tax=Parvularcula mediterranea TaxID=2732508 RepID=A0A7Y3W5C7_9PROT|nr:peptide deformylase [Parvularcula mediterranea]NNU16131.1 peptide deformylase [Parvularcula mediterranea]
MAIREIITVPDPRLREVSKEVDEVTDEHRALMDDMLETMYAAPGIGLAAIQVGVPLRIIVMDIADKEEGPQPRYFVNPRIIDPAEETAPYEEGCLSVPDAYEELERPATCVVEYLDYEGKPQRLEADGLLATCIQHEMDHLEGILFIDYLSRLKRDRIVKRLKKEAKLKAKEGDKALAAAE